MVSTRASRNLENTSSQNAAVHATSSGDVSDVLAKGQKNQAVPSTPPQEVPEDFGMGGIEQEGNMPGPSSDLRNASPTQRTPPSSPPAGQQAQGTPTPLPAATTSASNPALTSLAPAAGKRIGGSSHGSGSKIGGMSTKPTGIKKVNLTTALRTQLEEQKLSLIAYNPSAKGNLAPKVPPTEEKKPALDSDNEAKFCHPKGKHTTISKAATLFPFNMTTSVKLRESVTILGPDALSKFVDGEYIQKKLTELDEHWDQYLVELEEWKKTPAAVGKDTYTGTEKKSWFFQHPLIDPQSERNLALTKLNSINKVKNDAAIAQSSPTSPPSLLPKYPFICGAPDVSLPPSVVSLYRHTSMVAYTCFALRLEYHAHLAGSLRAKQSSSARNSYANDSNTTFSISDVQAAAFDVFGVDLVRDVEGTYVWSPAPKVFSDEFGMEEEVPGYKLAAKLCITGFTTSVSKRDMARVKRYNSYDSHAKEVLRELLLAYDAACAEDTYLPPDVLLKYSQMLQAATTPYFAEDIQQPRWLSDLNTKFWEDVTYHANSVIGTIKDTEMVRRIKVEAQAHFQAEAELANEKVLEKSRSNALWSTAALLDQDDGDRAADDLVERSAFDSFGGGSNASLDPWDIIERLGLLGYQSEEARRIAADFPGMSAHERLKDSSGQPSKHPNGDFRYKNELAHKARTDIRIPYFNQFDIASPHDPQAWQAAILNAPEDEPPTCSEATHPLLVPSQHQLVALLNNIEAGYCNHKLTPGRGHLYLMDQVGIGKTLVFLLLIAVRQYHKDQIKSNKNYYKTVPCFLAFKEHLIIEKTGEERAQQLEDISMVDLDLIRNQPPKWIGDVATPRNARNTRDISMLIASPTVQTSHQAELIRWMDPNKFAIVSMGPESRGSVAKRQGFMSSINKILREVHVIITGTYPALSGHAADHPTSKEGKPAPSASDSIFRGDFFYQFVVMDEIHQIRDPTSFTSSAIQLIALRGAYRVAASATPFFSGPIDIITATNNLLFPCTTRLSVNPSARVASTVPTTTSGGEQTVEKGVAVNPVPQAEPVPQAQPVPQAEPSTSGQAGPSTTTTTTTTTTAAAPAKKLSKAQLKKIQSAETKAAKAATAAEKKAKGSKRGKSATPVVIPAAVVPANPLDSNVDDPAAGVSDELPSDPQELKAIRKFGPLYPWGAVTVVTWHKITRSRQKAQKELDAAISIAMPTSADPVDHDRVIAETRARLQDFDIDDDDMVIDMIDDVDPLTLAKQKYAKQRKEDRVVMMDKVIGPIRANIGPYILRRTISSINHLGDTLADYKIPDVTPTFVDMHPWERTMYDEYKTLHAKDNNFQTILRRFSLDPYTVQNYYFDPSTPCSAKIDALIDILDKVVAEDAHLPEHKRRKVVVQVLWSAMVPMLSARLAMRGHRVAVLSGDTPANSRGELVARFQMDESHPAMPVAFAHTADNVSYYAPDPCRNLIITQVASAGINLFRASVLIMLDAPWSEDEVAQVIGRVVRRGQTQEVQIHRIMVNGTTDQWMYNISTGKKDLGDLILKSDVAQPMQQLNPITEVADTSAQNLPNYNMMMQKKQTREEKALAKTKQRIDRKIFTVRESDDDDDDDDEQKLPSKKALGKRKASDQEGVETKRVRKEPEQDDLDEEEEMIENRHVSTPQAQTNLGEGENEETMEQRGRGTTSPLTTIRSETRESEEDNNEDDDGDQLDSD